jgi:hypothetical protein
MRSTHSGKLERWLGKEQVEQLSKNMAGWYGPPIAVAGVPGKVFATRDGDFRGPIGRGAFATAQCFAEDVARRTKRAFREVARKQATQLNAGFTSLSDLISEATQGYKVRNFQFQKTSATLVTGGSSSLWGVGPYPAAGANAANAPGGEAPTDATTGAWPFSNPTGGDTQHIVYTSGMTSVANMTLLLYDRIFQVNKTMNSNATEAVTGVPTRYQNTTPNTADSAEGNFLFVEVGGTQLAATAHNWTVCTYNDQGGAASTLPSLTGNSSAVVRRLDHPLGQWFAPLDAGDTGITALTQMQCSAAVATGVINFVIGHPLAWIPLPVINIMYPYDGVTTSFNMERVFDDAALALMVVNAATTTASNFTGTIKTVAG